MIPALSNPPVPGALKTPYRVPKEPLVDFEYGGGDINDAGTGLDARLWKLYKEGDTIKVSSGSLVRPLFELINVSELALSFDQNARPFVAYIADGNFGFWWYDPTVFAMRFTNIGFGPATPMCCLDDRRVTQRGNSDVIVSYVNAGKLCCRVQRERYGVEHQLQTVGSATLRRFGPNDKYRLQWDVG